MNITVTPEADAAIEKVQAMIRAYFAKNYPSHLPAMDGTMPVHQEAASPRSSPKPTTKARAGAARSSAQTARCSPAPPTCTQPATKPSKAHNGCGTSISSNCGGCWRVRNEAG